MFPKKGKVFPGGNDRESGGATYTSMIASALRSELGNTHQATKTVMRWTRTSERTVKNWLGGHHGPAGDHLIVLIRESEAVFEALLSAAGRRDAIVAARMLAAKSTMVEVAASVERERSGTAHTDLHDRDQSGRRIGSGPDDPKGGPKGGPKDDPENAPEPGVSIHGLNPRQRWYLEVLAAGMEVKAGDLQRRWRVSVKTARRDVAALKAHGMIEFVGPRRTGRYKLRS